ncbi:hypothetical protein C8F01DRAFT_1154847 [Mycena amicta]|nr:hypothetical protein C8F01DRAFT_1154847 [Mycena amicta]
MDPSLLVSQLNQLLTALSLPLVLSSHTELTPLLLIGILECILHERLPIPDDIRDALATSSSAKVHGVKIFLGVVQADLMGKDVGISNMDPRRLARGEDTETRFVARLLCWYGRHTGLIPRPGGRNSPSTLSPSTLTQSARTTDLTSVYSPPEQPPRCIHEVPSPPNNILSPLSPRLTTLPSPTFPSALLSAPSPSTVRYDGYIAPVDEDAEIAAFEAQRAATTMPMPMPLPMNDADAEASRRRHVDLLERKAQLLAQIALLHAADLGLGLDP